MSQDSISSKELCTQLAALAREGRITGEQIANAFAKGVLAVHEERVRYRATLEQIAAGADVWASQKAAAALSGAPRPSDETSEKPTT